MAAQMLAEDSALSYRDPTGDAAVRNIMRSQKKMALDRGQPIESKPTETPNKEKR